MSRYELATRAAADLLEIVRYTNQNWGHAQAQRYREELDLAVQQLSLAPDRGEPAKQSLLACDRFRWRNTSPSTPSGRTRSSSCVSCIHV